MVNPGQCIVKLDPQVGRSGCSTEVPQICNPGSRLVFWHWLGFLYITKHLDLVGLIPKLNIIEKPGTERTLEGSLTKITSKRVSDEFVKCVGSVLLTTLWLTEIISLCS